MVTTIIIERGNYYFGMRSLRSSGEVKSETLPQWEPDPQGGCIAVCDANTDGKPIGDASLYAAWDANQYEQDIRKRLGISRANYPSLVELYRNAREDRVDLCDYCNGVMQLDCYICPIKECRDEREGQS